MCACIFCPGSGVVFLDSLGEVIGNSGVEAAIHAAEDVNVPSAALLEGFYGPLWNLTGQRTWHGRRPSHLF